MTPSNFIRRSMPNVPRHTSLTSIVPFDANHPRSFEDATAKKEAISRALRRSARQARAPSRIVTGGAGFQARKGVRAIRIGVILSFLILIVAPITIESIYWGLIASKQYATEMKFTIRAGESAGLSMLGISSAGQQFQDTQIIADYVRSRAMVDALNDKLDLRKMFGRSDIDYFSRFDSSKPVEDLEKYWDKRIDVKIELISSIVSVNVRAFSPEDSFAIAAEILRLSEDLVNDLSTRSRRGALTQAKLELDRAEGRLQTTSIGMRDARNAEGVLDATAAAEALK